MIAYYNEIDPRAAAWLRELIAQGHIAPGDVDERSIEDVRPSELVGYTQCHFFAGIGGWSLALRMAGWPDDRPVWTGSCPCQPFSTAGKGKGFADERHLWPAWYWLIRERRPDAIFGEQVASKAGREWLDLVFDDLEDSNYTCAPADICAAGIGAPHIRQRLYWVAHSNNTRRIQHAQRHGEQITRSEESAPRSDIGGCGEFDWLGDASRTVGELAHAQRAPTEQRRIAVESRESAGAQGARAPAESGRCGMFGELWSSCEWIACRDGKTRPIEPSTFPLAHGVPCRVGLLRGYGNAIVPQLAAAFIEASGLIEAHS